MRTMTANALWTKFATAALLVSLIVSCGIQAEKRDLQAFQALNANGKQLPVEGKNEEAFEQYRQAYDIALRIDWPEGQITSKIDMADVRSVQKNYAGAEKLLLESKSVCSTAHRCSREDLELIWNSLMFLYVYSIQDLSKAKQLIREIIKESRDSVDTDELHRLLEKYTGWMRGAGFPAEATGLEAEIRRTGPSG
jgi:hypothetical protein